MDKAKPWHIGDILSIAKAIDKKGVKRGLSLNLAKYHTDSRTFLSATANTYRTHDIGFRRLG